MLRAYWAIVSGVYYWRVRSEQLGLAEAGMYAGILETAVLVNGRL